MQSFGRKQLEQPTPIEHILNFLESVPSHVFFAPKKLYLREAWIGAIYGKAAGYEKLNLSPNCQCGHDIHLLRGIYERAYDVTECRGASEDCRSSAYYHQVTPKDQDPHGNSLATERGAFGRCVANKLRSKSKSSGGEKHLILYVNTGRLPNSDEIRLHVENWRAEHQNSFASLQFVFTQRSVFRVLPDFRELK